MFEVSFGCQIGLSGDGGIFPFPCEEGVDVG